MKKLFVVLFFLAATLSFAQQKYALVIGNGNYTGLSRLANPVNDANDMTAALQGLGFTVDKVLDGNLDQIENAIIRLKNRLSVSKNSYGFFFYAGHGVQSNGVNYLIPVGASISTENSLRDRAVSVQWALSKLNDAGNELNVVVLDTCRDNPFAWARSGSRSLSVISNQPADSIVVYATSAGSTAADGTGRNSLFTAQLLKNIATPGLEVNEIFRRTGADVAQASNRQQIPAVYNQFFGNAYLSSAPVVSAPSPQSSVAVGSITVTSAIAGEILIDGKSIGISVKDGGTATITNVSTGNTEVAVKEPNGAITKAAQMVMLRQGQTVTARIERPASTAVQPTPSPQPTPAPAVQPAAPAQYKIGDRGPAGGIVFYDKGNNNNGWCYMEAAPVHLQNAAWGLYGITVSRLGFGIGSGKQNTELIIAALNQNKESGKAAQLCKAYTQGGYSDWFLPSQDELDLMYKNLKLNNLGGFKLAVYWSSSQHDKYNAWGLDFYGGGQPNFTKNLTSDVRAVRAF
jgi:hypothetical protein